MSDSLTRYSIIKDKNSREIVLLRGGGCQWRRCRFCDYHMDFSRNEVANFALNRKVLSHVTGLYRHLEVINSGSFCDLDDNTMTEIIRVCREKQISLLHFEAHWMHRALISDLRCRFAAQGITVKIKMGIETFDVKYREEVLDKGMADVTAKDAAAYADEVCLLFGLTGQTLVSMSEDITTGLQYFERVCINIMVQNTTRLLPSPAVIQLFRNELYLQYKDNPQVDILMENTDFGVGEC